MKKFVHFWQTRTGFFMGLLTLLWLKNLLADAVDFSLGISSAYQVILLILNPLATGILFLGLAFFVKNTKLYYWLIMIVYLANNLLLYLNVIYFREFSDFITLNTVLGYSTVNKGLSMSSLALTEPHDVLYWLDVLIILLLLLMGKIKLDSHFLRKRQAFAIFSFSLFLLMFNLVLGEMGRPQLLTRTFDSQYLVKYLGIDTYSIYDCFETWQNQSVRADATENQLKKIIKYHRQHYVAANPKYYGIAKGKNVFVIHLESFQQFLIDDKVNGQVVTPFLNKLYHSKSTIAFKNFFHQVGQGKTSDAENMLETGTFGLPEGSLFSELGSTQTFQSAPAILQQQAHYTTAVFHGDVASFWNRDNVYKNMGYQYFFSARYYDSKGDNSVGYGLKDKLLFADSVKYLQYLQQPFYVKYITLTNHFPFELSAKDDDFKRPQTGNQEVDDYFRTANYLDQSIKEFFDFLQKSGLAKNSIVILYGDHYGLSNSENPYLAKTFKQDPQHFKWYNPQKSWSSWDNAQLQRVPFMICLPNYHHGGIKKTFGGEIDVLPTLLHLLGINSKPYLEFGSDLLAKGHNQTVAFRNRDFVTPKFSDLNGKLFNAAGKKIRMDRHNNRQILAAKQHADQQLDISDLLNSENLLRFYHPKGFKKVNPKNYNYLTGLQQELKLQAKLGTKSTSLFSEHGNHSLESLYQTDAPELTATTNKSTSGQ
ncbi:MAG: LTA synthase family protein [Liquorilactobacillus nagelii]|uniref:LTA synthase family protein n=1 Tax=Liquorilactobacillus nagelii TaxID=82688 RepID=UPI00242C04F5|nr:LTA synthase family protein [Liquorilactobacillus nagelii]MCI1632708.1 LTA synthase family protein [Liquorilactobacillus nagelii]